jgi:hypothetical protein
VRPFDIGSAAASVLGTACRGRVVSVHRKAVYLRFGVGLCALTTTAAPPGPLHLRVPGLPDVRPGGAVRTDGRTVRGAGWAVPVAAPAWRGSLPAPGRLAGAIRPEQAAVEATRLGGRGPGLTPAGDDVLAGLLLVARAAAGPAAEPALRAAVAAARTGYIATAFLASAARGQCIAPAHDVLHTLAASGGADTAEARTACARLGGIGASSGTALLLGIRAGLMWNRAPLPADLSTKIDVCIRC